LERELNFQQNQYQWRSEEQGEMGRPLHAAISRRRQNGVITVKIGW